MLAHIAITASSRLLAQSRCHSSTPAAGHRYDAGLDHALHRIVVRLLGRAPEASAAM